MAWPTVSWNDEAKSMDGGGEGSGKVKGVGGLAREPFPKNGEEKRIQPGLSGRENFPNERVQKCTRKG